MRSCVLKVCIDSCSRNFECKILNRNQSTHLRKCCINGLLILRSSKTNIIYNSLLNFLLILRLFGQLNTYLQNQLMFTCLFNIYLYIIYYKKFAYTVEWEVAKQVQSAQFRPSGRKDNEQSGTQSQEEAAIYSGNSKNNIKHKFITSLFYL